MRVALLALAVGLLFSAGTTLLISNPNTQLAAVGASATAQTSSIVLDTARLVALLKQLLSIRAAASPAVTVPYATSTPAKTSTATSTAVVAPAKKTVSANATVAVAASQQTATQTALGIVLPTLRSALVNIVCLPSNSQGTLKGISGSGVIISPNGIILTVAHVAQYELIAAARPDLMTCYVRTGSPAAFTYRAKPVYISAAWVSQNAHIISSTDPTGTGENDFALLAITSSDTSASLPSTYPYVSLWNGLSVIGDPVVIGSYGAEFLTTARIRNDLFPTLVYDTVRDRYTFGTNTVDLISLGGNAAAQQGSSGGGIANQNGQLVGLITTSSSGADLASRDLHAITAAYVQRAFMSESGTDVNSYVSGNPAALVSSYAAQASSLANMLLKANDIN